VNLIRPLILPLLLVMAASPVHALRIDELSHLHGLAFKPGGAGDLILASHNGLYLAGTDGEVKLLSTQRDDLMALTVDPSQPHRLFASGHPATGGNLGLVISEDAGATWQHRSDGDEGPVDFHQLTVSGADPSVLYGVHRMLQVSRDAGRTWTAIAPPPEKLIALAASASAAEQIYAATENGLQVSSDGGREWRQALLYRNPASLVHVTPDGTVYTFVLGRGLLAAREPDLKWETLANGFGGHYPLQMAVASDDPQWLAVLTHRGRLFVSADGGRNWQRFAAQELPADSAASRGARLYVEFCQACHGGGGIGESLGTPTAPRDQAKLAPTLDGSGHGWHHADDQLVQTILEGSVQRGGRMPAWKSLLGPDDAHDLVAYIKTLWGPRERACQGRKHMNCDWVPGE